MQVPKRTSEKTGYGAMALAGLVVVTALGLKLSDRQAAPIEILYESDAAPDTRYVLQTPTHGNPQGVSVPIPDQVPQSQFVTVHVAGAVKHPGLIRLSAESRVQDAIAKAGGTLAEADLEQLNLAAPLVDGSQLYVPKKSLKGDAPIQPLVSQTPYAGSRGSTSYGSTKSSAPKSKGSRVVSLNSGSQSDFETLPGVGPATAKKIVDYRREHGGFSSIEELMAVKGIGAKKLAGMRKFLRL